MFDHQHQLQVNYFVLLSFQRFTNYCATIFLNLSGGSFACDMLNCVRTFASGVALTVHQVKAHGVQAKYPGQKKRRRMANQGHSMSPVVANRSPRVSTGHPPVGSKDIPCIDPSCPKTFYRIGQRTNHVRALHPHLYTPNQQWSSITHQELRERRSRNKIKDISSFLYFS